MKKTMLMILGLILILGIMAIPRLYSREENTIFSVGKVGDFSIGAIQLVTPAKALVIRDTEGIYAVSAVCSHLGCLIREKKGILTCPCHGAQFDLSGKVLKGPAKDNLVWYAVEMDTGGNLFVDTSKRVAAGTKLTINK